MCVSNNLCMQEKRHHRSVQIRLRHINPVGQNETFNSPNEIKHEGGEKVEM